MKFFVIFCTILLSLPDSNAIVRWYETPDCRDCWGVLRLGGAWYYDGCNWCRCRSNGVPDCFVLQHCLYNRCIKPLRRY